MRKENQILAISKKMQMLELSGKDFKDAIINMLQQSIKIS